MSRLRSRVSRLNPSWLINIMQRVGTTESSLWRHSQLLRRSGSKLCPSSSLTYRSASPFIPTGKVMGRGTAQGDEKRVLFSSYGRRKRRPSLCHLDRSEAQWRDLRSSGPFPGILFDRAQRSGGSCGSAVSSWATPVWRLLSLEAPPLPLSSRPKQSAVDRSAVSVVPSWECFSTERSAVKEPAVVAESPHSVLSIQVAPLPQ
jgi:hypothetical protein